MDLAQVFLDSRELHASTIRSLAGLFCRSDCRPRKSPHDLATPSAVCANWPINSAMNPARQFFAEPPRPGAKASEVVQQQIVQLRKQNQSIYDISEALKKEGIRQSPGSRGRGASSKRGSPSCRGGRTTSVRRAPSPPPATTADARALSLEPRTIQHQVRRPVSLPSGIGGNVLRSRASASAICPAPRWSRPPMRCGACWR